MDGWPGWNDFDGFDLVWMGPYRELHGIDDRNRFCNRFDITFIH